MYQIGFGYVCLYVKIKAEILYSRLRFCVCVNIKVEIDDVADWIFASARTLRLKLNVQDSGFVSM